MGGATPPKQRQFAFLRGWGFSLLAGALWGGGFLEPQRWWMSGLAPVALSWLLREPRCAFLRGWLHGAVAWIVSLSWIASTVSTFGLLPGWVGGAALGLLSLYLGLFHAVFLLLGSRLWRLGGWRLHLGIPALWVSLEVLRGWLLTGFPWNPASHLWMELPGFLPAAASLGTWGLSFVVVGAGVGFVRAMETRNLETAAGTLLSYVLLLSSGARFGAPEVLERSSSFEVAIVQPNSPARPFFDPWAGAEDFRRLREMSQAACTPGTLLVWPESAAWPLSWQVDRELREVVRSLNEAGCALLFNSPFVIAERTYNSVLLLSPDASQPQRYDKRHLVPFGEYVPLARWFPLLPRIARAAGDFSAADEVRLLKWVGESLGIAICYEVVFPGEVAGLVAAGATLLLTVTNDSWYGDTAAPWQHLRAARFRAAEHRRWLLRAAITGISARIDPLGQVRDSLGVGAVGTLVGRVEGVRTVTLFSRAPWGIPVLSFLLAFAGWLFPGSGGSFSASVPLGGVSERFRTE